MPTFQNFSFEIRIDAYDVHQALLDLAWDVCLYRSIGDLVEPAAETADELQATWVELHDLWLYGLWPSLLF